MTFQPLTDKLDGRKQLTFGSLFAGIGGFCKAFEDVGMTAGFQVEIDSQCRSVLRRHFHDTVQHDDVRRVRAWLERKDATRVIRPDVLCGGFPCQDLSVAGRRAGLAGSRSGLWFTFRRIAALLRPRWLLIENVDGLRSSNGGRDLGAILRALGDMGYGWAYRVFDSQWFGLAQRRERVFIVGSLGNWRRAAEVLFERDCLPWHPAPSRDQRQGTAACITAGAHPGSHNGQDDHKDGRLIPIDMRQASRGGTMTNNRRNGTSGGAPGTGIGEPGDPSFTVCESHTPAVAFNWQGGGKQTTLGFDQASDIAGAIHVGQSQAIAFAQNQRDEVRDLRNLAGSVAAEPGMKQQTYVAYTLHGSDGTKSTATESDVACALRGRAPGSSENASTTVAFQPRIARNGRGQPKETVDALVGSESGVHGDSKPHVTSRQGVRRLTPMECERLQGFPDEWTRYGADGEELSDSARYRMLGNAVSVPVVAWIGRRIVEATERP